MSVNLETKRGFGRQGREALMSMFGNRDYWALNGANPAAG